MRKLFTGALITLAFVLRASAVTPLARISSTQPFERNGTTVPVGGVASWPLFAGDLIVTHAAPATILFHNGSRIVLEPNSELRIDVQDRKPLVSLLHGSGKYFVAGAVVTLSTTAAVILDARENTGNSDPTGYQKPPSASPSR